jgi:hypothetical protein
MPSFHPRIRVLGVGLAALALLAVGVGGTVAASNPPTLYACFDVYGNVRMSASNICLLPGGGRLVSWGSAGSPGPIGATGVTGLTGLTGPTGAVGPIGAPGPIGATGVTGLTGLTGPTGAVGPIGAPGPLGATGPTGATGAAMASSAVTVSGQDLLPNLPGFTVTVFSPPCPGGMVATNGWVSFAGSASDIALWIPNFDGPSVLPPSLPTQWSWSWTSVGLPTLPIPVALYAICAP